MQTDHGMAGNALGSLELQALLRTLHEKRRLILLVALFTLIASLLVAFLRPPRYTASVLLQVHHKRESSLGALNQAGDSVRSALTDEPVSVQMSLIRSRFILGPVIQSLQKSSVHRGLAESQQVEKLRSRLLVRDLTGLSENYPDKPAILQLTLIGTRPDEVMQTVNAIAKMTQERDRQRRKSEAGKTLNFLDHELKVVQAELQHAEDSLNQYRLAHGKMDAKLETQHLLARLSDIDQKLESARLKSLELSQQYTSLHPYVIAMTQKQAALNAQRKMLLDEIRKMTATDQVADNLAREVSVKKDLYMTLLNQIHAEQVVAAGIVSDIGILSPATYSEVLLPPHIVLVGLAGGMAGLMLGCFGVLAWRISRYLHAGSHPSCPA